MMLAHLAGTIVQRELRTHLQNGTLNTGDVTIRWNVADAPVDPNVEAAYQADSFETELVKAFLYFVSAKSAMSQWTSFKAGDVIVTFDAGQLDLSGKRQVSFLLPDGLTYTQQETDRDPVEFWSVFVGGQPLTRTLLLRRKP